MLIDKSKMRDRYDEKIDDKGRVGRVTEDPS